MKTSEDNRCPVCAGPMHECTNPASEGKWQGTGPVRCHRATAIQVVQDKFFDGRRDNPPKHAQALMWGVKERGTPN